MIPSKARRWDSLLKEGQLGGYSPFRRAGLLLDPQQRFPQLSTSSRSSRFSVRVACCSSRNSFSSSCSGANVSSASTDRRGSESVQGGFDTTLPSPCLPHHTGNGNHREQRPEGQFNIHIDLHSSNLGNRIHLRHAECRIDSAKKTERWHRNGTLKGLVLDQGNQKEDHRQCN